MTGFRRILVCHGKDESESGLLTYARTLAAMAPQSKLDFLHVVDELDSSDRHAAKTQVRVMAELRDSVAKHVGLNGLCRCCVRFGELFDQILLYAAETRADVILLGHHPERRGRRSLARRIAGTAPCALWMAPDNSPPRITRVLTAMDLSASSAATVRVAAAVAASAHASEFYLLHVRRRHAPYSEVALARFASWMNLQPLRTRLLVEDGETIGRGIVEAANRIAADLVVMGARGHNLSSAVLLGAETEQTVRESAVPVLVVRPPETTIPLLGALLADPLH